MIPTSEQRRFSEELCSKLRKAIQEIVTDYNTELMTEHNQKISDVMQITISSVNNTLLDLSLAFLNEGEDAIADYKSILSDMIDYKIKAMKECTHKECNH